MSQKYTAIRYDPATDKWSATAGAWVGAVTEDMCSCAKEKQRNITLEFNDIPIVATPNSEPQELFRDWWQVMDMRAEQRGKERRQSRIERAWLKVQTFCDEERIETLQPDSVGMRRIIELILNMPDY